MRPFNTKYNYNPEKFPGVAITAPSMTVPDQTLSLRQLLDRHSRGLPIGGSLGQPHYDETSEGVDMRTLDLVDRQEFLEAKRKHIETLEHRYNEQLNEVKKRKEDERLKKDNERLELEKLRKEVNELRGNSTNQS